MAAPSFASATPTQAGEPGAPATNDRYPATEKPVSTTLTANDSREHVHVKFAEGSQVRLRGAELTSAVGTDLPAVRDVLRSGAVSAVRRLFTTSEETLRAFTDQAAARSGPLPNLRAAIAALPAGGNQSPAATSTAGTPENVLDAWDRSAAT